MQELKHSGEEIIVKLFSIVCVVCHLPFINTLNSHKHSVAGVLFFPPFYKWENWGLGRWSHELKMGFSLGVWPQGLCFFLVMFCGFSLKILNELIFLPLTFYWWVSTSPYFWITQSMIHFSFWGTANSPVLLHPPVCVYQVYFPMSNFLLIIRQLLGGGENSIKHVHWL